MDIRILDVTDEVGFGRVPPCVDPGFDHRTCDYWEDDRRGSKAARLSWLEATPAPAAAPTLAGNPFAPARRGPAFNPFDPKAGRAAGGNPFGPFADDHDAPENLFAPKRDRGPAVPADSPRKLQLLARGAAIFGSYAKVLESDGNAVVYCQFGPLSAYPRAQRVRDLYPKLPSAPLPAVITCIATTAEARGRGLATQLVAAVIEDLTARGFSAVETYPEPEARPDATSAATPAFWLACGFALAIDDDRFPVMRREL
ncbi:MAG: GNAT family N-acetyltransferase [Chloroflexota bacterium]